MNNHYSVRIKTGDKKQPVFPLCRNDFSFVNVSSAENQHEYLLRRFLVNSHGRKWVSAVHSFFIYSLDDTQRFT